MRFKIEEHKNNQKESKNDMNYRMILEHIIAVILSVYTLRNLFSVEIFSGIQSIIMLVTIVYCVYVYMVYWDITKN